MLYWFPLYGHVNQSWVYIYPGLLGPPSYPPPIQTVWYSDCTILKFPSAKIKFLVVFLLCQHLVLSSFLFLHLQWYLFVVLIYISLIMLRQPTPVFLPGESSGQRSLVGCCLFFTVRRVKFFFSSLSALHTKYTSGYLALF